VFRNEKPGPGRFRQFMQFDADTVGSASMAADAEMCMMAADTMEALGIPRGSYVVKVNNRKVLDGVMEAIGLEGETNVGKRLTALRALDKYERLGKGEVLKLLGTGREDESRDFTKGAGLDDKQIKHLIWFLTLRSEPWGIVENTRTDFNPQIKLSPDGGGEPYITDVLTAFDNAYGWNKQFHEGVKEFREIEKLVTAAGYGDGRIILEPSVVRGLEYYTGPVYEVDLTVPMEGEQGKPIRLGSVGGGGRYDGLISRFRDEAVPATGFSIGVSRLLTALQHLSKMEIKADAGPVVVTVFDKERIADYQRMVATLRDAEYAPGKKIRAELYLGDGKFRGQMKYADERRSPCVVIQGSNEKNSGEVQIKDLILGAQIAGLTKERDEYVTKRVKAQFAVPEDQLVDAVCEVLARHDPEAKKARKARKAREARDARKARQAKEKTAKGRKTKTPASLGKKRVVAKKRAPKKSAKKTSAKKTSA